MSLPSLYHKDVLIPHMGEGKEKLKDIVGIYYIMEWFDKRIPKNKNEKPFIEGKSISDRVVILKSGTGSGKSTSIAPVLFRKFYKRWNSSQILLTQPTQLTTQSVTFDISHIPAYKNNLNGMPSIELFKNIGYQYKENVYKPIERGILVCTTGILLQILKNNNYDYIYNKFNAIIVDEVHNRSIDIDLILYFLLQLVNHNTEKCPFIILMSATMDPYKFSKYFKTDTIFEVTGLNYPINENFLSIDTPNYINKSIEIIEDIHLKNIDEVYKSKNIDILLFVHNKSILEKIYNKLSLLNEGYTKNYILPIMLSGDIFRKGDKNYNFIYSNLNLIKINIKNKKVSPVRRVIIGTNVAETGITINTLKYCIDIGFVNTVEFNPIYNSIVLLTKPETQSSALQRKGRVGRKFTGEWYPLFTKDVFNSLQIDNIPNLFTEELTFNILNIIIKLSKLGISEDNEYILDDTVIPQNEIKKYTKIDIKNIELIDDIPYDMLKLGLKKLYTLGYVYNNMYPTKLGMFANKFQKIKLEYVKIILAGYKYGANIEDLIIIVAYLTVGKQNVVSSKFKSFNSQFKKIDNKCIDSYNYNKLKTRLLISCEFIDFLLFYKQFEIICCEKRNTEKIDIWCQEHKVNYKGMLNIIKVKDEIINDMIFKMNYNPYENNNNIFNLLNNINMFKNNEFMDEIIKIKYCLSEGFKLNIATFNSDINEYMSNDTNQIITTNSYLTKNLPIVEEGRDFIQYKPYIILYDSLIMKYDSSFNKFVFLPINCISVLDGYVNIDNDFVNS